MLFWQFLFCGLYLSIAHNLYQITFYLQRRRGLWIIFMSIIKFSGSCGAFFSLSYFFVHLKRYACCISMGVYGTSSLRNQFFWILEDPSLFVMVYIWNWVEEVLMWMLLSFGIPRMWVGYWLWNSVIKKIWWIDVVGHWEIGR